MPTVSFSGPPPLVAAVDMSGSATVREVVANNIGGGAIEVELSDYEVGVRLTARADVLANLLADAVAAVARLRGLQ